MKTPYRAPYRTSINKTMLKPSTRTDQLLQLPLQDILVRLPHVAHQGDPPVVASVSSVAVLVDWVQKGNTPDRRYHSLLPAQTPQRAKPNRVNVRTHLQQFRW